MNNNRGSITMLDTQYRMHPEISRFPSTIFYDSKLQNALEVVERASAPWHKHARNEFPPYCFFDVASGREDQSAIGQSLYNNDEVLAAVQLYDRLCSEFPDVMVGSCGR